MVVDVTFAGPVAVVKLCSGENAFNISFTKEIMEALDQVIANEDVKALVMTGDGKFFSNGVDLKWSDKQTEQTRVLLTQGLRNLTMRILTFPVPTVAALNGHAFAYGACLAMAFDYRVMNSERGWFCLPEVRLPITYGLHYLELLRSKLPSGRPLTDALVMGLRLAASDAQKAGIADDIAPLAKMMEVSINRVTQPLKLGAIRRDVMEIMKKDLYRNIVKLSIEEGLVHTPVKVARM